ncbi:hypothetical protein HDV57DRAFT_256535 [Trichoderma longibrachiatum]
MRLLAPASLALCATTQRLLTADSASAPIPPSIPPPLTIANSPAEVSTVFEAKQTRQLGLSRLPNPPVAQMERSSSSSQGELGHASTHLAISIWGQRLPLRRCEPDEAERGAKRKGAASVAFFTPIQSRHSKHCFPSYVISSLQRASRTPRLTRFTATVANKPAGPEACVCKAHE